MAKLWGWFSKEQFRLTAACSIYEREASPDELVHVTAVTWTPDPPPSFADYECKGLLGDWRGCGANFPGGCV